MVVSFWMFFVVNFCASGPLLLLRSLLSDYLPQLGLMRSQAHSVHGVVAEMRQIHTDYRVLRRKRVGRATVSRGERPDPFLDRLLLLFWAHYMEDGPHLLCTGSL